MLFPTISVGTLLSDVVFSYPIIIRTVLAQGIVGAHRRLLADRLNVVPIDEEQVIVPGVAGTIPLERFIGEWNGPLQPH